MQTLEIPYNTGTIIDLLDVAGKIVDTVRIGETGALGFRVDGKASCRWWKDEGVTWKVTVEMERARKSYS
jgi:hypothetical protein